MKYCLLAASLLAATAGAAPIAPARYVDAQGVEVIHNRGAEPAVASGQVTTPAEPPAPAPRKPVAAAAIDARMQVSADAQRARDRDRVAILQQELATEVRALEASFQRAKQAAPDKLSAADSRRVTEEMYAHQQNILSLNSELRRASR